MGRVTGVQGPAWLAIDSVPRRYMGLIGELLSGPVGGSLLIA
jgi:hypothetical protein